MFLAGGRIFEITRRGKCCASFFFLKKQSKKLLVLSKDSIMIKVVDKYKRQNLERRYIYAKSKNLQHSGLRLLPNP